MSRRTKAEIQADAVRLLDLMIQASEEYVAKHPETGSVNNGRTVGQWVDAMGWMPWETSKFHTTIARIRNSEEFGDFVIWFLRHGTRYYGISRTAAGAREYIAMRIGIIRSHTKNAHLMTVKAIEKYGPVETLVEVRSILNIAMRILDEFGT